MMIKKAMLLTAAVILLCAACTAALGETLTLSLVGDCTVGSDYAHHGYAGSFVTKIGEQGMDYPFSLSAELFAADDLTIANCEVSFTTRKPADANKHMNLSAPPSYAQVFALGNVDVCNIINNHAMDFGAKGYQSTYDTLTELGIGVFGGDWLYTTEIKGVRIGFAGMTYPITNAKLKTIRQQIEQLRAEGCGLVIASAHWGHEEDYNLNSQQKDSAPSLIDMGADIVFGHGPHVLQPIQYYNGGLILYSTANFTFGANSMPNDADTAIIQVEYEVSEDGMPTLKKLTAIPYCMHQSKDFRPWPYTEQADLRRVWKKLWRAASPKSDLPETFLTTGEVVFGAEQTD